MNAFAISLHQNKQVDEPTHYRWALTHLAAEWPPQLLVISELFSLDDMAEVLRAKVDEKSAISLQRGQFDPKFPVEGDVPHQ